MMKICLKMNECKLPAILILKRTLFRDEKVMKKRSKVLRKKMMMILTCKKS
jgi:hypothetical protein